MANSQAALAVAAKHKDLVTKYNNSLNQIEELHDVASREVLPSVLEDMQMNDDPTTELRMRAFIDDRATLFRFYRRGRYSLEGAISLLTTTLTWRLRTDLDSLSISSLHPLYVSPPNRPPLFWCNTRCKDKLGRPVGIISLGSLERSVKDDGSNGLDECREYIVGCMESIRRYISNLYAKTTEEPGFIEGDVTKPLQMVIIFSLQSSGMANLELELLPFLLDLLKNHFPGMVGAVYIVHYGWVHSGMWALAKRLLPQQALARIFFPSNKELPEHFNLENLPSALGGTWDVKLNDESNNVMKRFARPNLQGVLYNVKGAKGSNEHPDWESNSAPPSPRGISGTSSPVVGWSSRAVSRSSSFDSLAEHFYSSFNTPRHLTPRASQTPTPHNEASHINFSSTDADVSSILRMTPTAAMKLQQVQKSRERAARFRSNSDANKREEFSMSSQAISPGISRGNSPTRSRRRTSTNQASRNVHFQSSKVEEKGGEAMRRIGSLRDFRLSQSDFETIDLRGDSSGSEQSDKSGKVGETAKDLRQDVAQSSGGFFARWRQSSSEQIPLLDSKEVSKQKDKDGLVELEATPMASPQLQVTDMDEPPLSGFETRSAGRNVLSRRTRKFGALPGHVSPYNSSNPFYGYPAYPMSHGDDSIRRSSLHGPYQFGGGQEQRRLQFRRRKRDLLRTLMYLFVLRLLSAHRGVRNQILTIYRNLIRAARVGGIAEDEEESEEWKKANTRYNRIRSASLRYTQQDKSKTSNGDDTQRQQRQKQKPQPLVQLGFRKRYAFLLLFLFIMAKKDWRGRLTLSLRDVLGFAGVSKAGMETVSQGKAIDAGDEVDDVNLLDLNVEQPTAAASISGFHLRRRLGWK